MNSAFLGSGIGVEIIAARIPGRGAGPVVPQVERGEVREGGEFAGGLVAAVVARQIERGEVGKRGEFAGPLVADAVELQIERGQIGERRDSPCPLDADAVAAETERGEGGERAGAVVADAVAPRSSEVRLGSVRIREERPSTKPLS